MTTAASGARIYTPDDLAEVVYSSCGADVSFRLFDVLVVTPERDWWLGWPDVVDVASKLGVETVEMLGANLSLEEAIALVQKAAGK